MTNSEPLTLNEPLLSQYPTDPITSNNSMRDVLVDWPETPIQLFVPQEWQSKVQKASNCEFHYDEDQNLLKLVDSSNHDNVIDVLDPEDIIGVTVEVESFDTSPSPRATNATNGDTPNAPTTDTLADTQGQAVLTIYAYPRCDPNHPPDSGLSILRWCGMGRTHPRPNPNYKRPQGDEWQQWGGRYAFHRHLKAAPTEDLAALQALVKALRQAARLPTERGRALVVVNPQSGPKRNAEEVYENVVNILFEQAGVEHDLLVTDHPSHARERMAKGCNGPDILDYSMLVSVGGDGIAHECLQGWKARDDWQEILRKITVGFVGAGTSNGMAKSIARTSHEQSSVLDATFLIVKGHSKTTDISEYQTTSHSYWSFLTFSWAWIASIDIDSEVLRSLGPLRFDLWGVLFVLRMKAYRAKFSYLPAKAKPVDGMPALTQELSADSGWVTEEDDFFIFWPSHVPDAAESTYHCPPSRLDDGVFQIVIVRPKNVSRVGMVKMLLGLGAGAHYGMPGAEFIECTAYRLEPKEGINCLDGEIIESGRLQAKVVPGALKIFCK